jgi:hypothetical protein
MNTKTLLKRGLNFVVLFSLFFLLCSTNLSGLSHSAWATDLSIDDPVIQDCVDKLRMANLGHLAARGSVAQETFQEGVKAGGESRENVWGSIGVTRCFQTRYGDITDILMGIFQGYASLFMTVLMSAIEALLDFVCGFITDFTNAALSHICIPLPGISLPSLSLSAPEGKYCNGLSGSDFFWLNQAPFGDPIVEPIASEVEEGMDKAILRAKEKIKAE